MSNLPHKGTKTSRISATVYISLAAVCLAAALFLVSFSQVIPALLAFGVATVFGALGGTAAAAGRLQRSSREQH